MLSRHIWIFLGLILILFSSCRDTADHSAPVILTETPLTLIGYVAVTEPLSFKSLIARLDSDFEKDTSFVFPKNFRLSGISSLWEQFFFVSENPGVIHTFSTDTWEIIREYAAAPPRPEFTGLWVDRRLVFSTLNGDAGILNNYGNLVIRTPPAGGKTIQCLAADDTYIYAEHVSLNGAETGLTVFYRITGAPRTQLLIKQDIVALIPFEGKVLILSNTSEKAIISEYDPGPLKLTELSVLENVKIISALKIDDHLFLILTPEKVLMFNRYHNQITDYLHATYQFGKYDSLNNYLYLINGKTLDVIQFVTSNLVHQVVFDDKLVDFHIMYNK